MTTMRYKDFIFPHNPAKIEIALQSRLAEGHCPGYGPVYQPMGPARRVITGEGSFFGPLAENCYRELEEVFFEDTVGLLTLPTMAPVRAYFTHLTYLGQGDGEVVRYAFQFVEDIMPGRGKEQSGDRATYAAG